MKNLLLILLKSILELPAPLPARELLPKKVVEGTMETEHVRVFG